jgi:pimeloyl-ACP methyl ester carboxylesterase
LPYPEQFCQAEESPIGRRPTLSQAACGPGEYFRNFEQDATDFQQFARNKLTMPVRVISGEKSGGVFLIDQARLVANDVQGKVIQGSGHWPLEEAPEKVIPVLNEYVH